MSAAASPQSVAATSFAALIAPNDPIAFLAQDFGKRWRLLAGDASKVAGVFGWDDFNRLLAMDVWSAQTMSIALDGQRAPPGAYCEQSVNRSKTGGAYPKRERVKALLAEGASIVLDDMSSLAPPVQAIMDVLRETFNARGAANLYYSQRARQAFASHYDRHEVFALQILGKKKWRIYEGRADAPIEHARFLNVPQADYDQMKGALDQEVTTSPGDLLYLPRGQFHDALAMEGDSLHITFSCQPAMGLHLVQDMVNRLIDESTFRADLPRLDQPDTDAVLKAHLERLVARLAEIYTGENGVAIAKALIRGYGGAVEKPYDIPNHTRRRR